LSNLKPRDFAKRTIIGGSVIAILLSGCSTRPVNNRLETSSPPLPIVTTTPKLENTISTTPLQTKEAIKAKLIQDYNGKHPLQWGEKVTGVRRKLDTSNKVIALTFDACGGKSGNGVDQKLIDYLVKEKIPATLFINGRWIEANPKVFQALVNNPLFEIENHGTEHKPLSVSGKSAYQIQGTSSVSSVVDEVFDNADKIEKLSGYKPKFFRSGTAYYDELAVRIVNDLGEEAVNFSVLGDAGATFSKVQVFNALLSSKPGSIVILHMNHPEKQTASGVIAAIPELRKKGYSFAKLNDYPLL
jgi:peptidoglycan/xylan/chitin deacetylase (PgdA/CDA1 family)